MVQDVDDIRQLISSGQWQLAPGTTTVQGQQAVELTKTDGQVHWTLWVNAESYTPIPPGYPQVAPAQQH
jgi:hypothetical protein